MYNQDLKRKRGKEAARVDSIEEGKAKGRYEQALEIAAEMKRKNFPEETIAELTKLKTEEIKSL